MKKFIASVGIIILDWICFDLGFKSQLLMNWYMKCVDIMEISKYTFKDLQSLLDSKDIPSEIKDSILSTINQLGLEFPEKKKSRKKKK